MKPCRKFSGCFAGSNVLCIVSSSTRLPVTVSAQTGAPCAWPCCLYSLSPAVIIPCSPPYRWEQLAVGENLLAFHIGDKRKAIVNSTRLSFTLESLVISWISTITPRTSFGTLLNNTHIFEPNTQYYIFDFGTTEILGRWDSPRSA